MKRIVLDLQCAMFADAITMALERSDPDFLILRSDAPGKTAAICKSSHAYALIMEVTGYTPWRLEERLRLRDEVGRLCPSCKVLLLVDENADRALAALMLPGLAACGKESGPDATGKYLRFAVSEDGGAFTAPEVEGGYVELQKGGKGEIYDGLSFDLKWSLDGESLTGSYKIFGFDVDITGTLRDGVLEIHDDTVVTRYLKEGAQTPDWAKDVAAAPEKGRLAGLYTLYAMEAMDGSFMRIDYDADAGYTGELQFEGEEPDSFTLEDELGVLNFAGGDQMGFFEDAPGVIGITSGEIGGTIYFALESVERPEVPVPTEPVVDELVEWWNGDWYGWWFMYGCKGSYEDLDGAYWDCEAHIEIDPATYTGTMEMWDDEQYQNMGGIGMVDVSLSSSGTGEHGTLMSEGGWFEEMTLSHADWIIDPGLVDFENMLVIDGSYDDDNGNVYSFRMMLRPWGQLWEDVAEESRPWSYENWYKPMIEDGVTKMSVRFGDPDPSVYEDLEPKNEDVPDSGTGVSEASYGKSNAAATGEVSFDTLKNGWETIRGDENKYDLLYENVRDIMGCDGEAYKIDGVKNSYCWQAVDAILTVTFKVLEDGNEELNAFSVTGMKT